MTADTQVQRRRDTTANIQAYGAGVQGETGIDLSTTPPSLVIFDGATAGGNRVTPFTGTWTPTMRGSSTAGAPTYSTQHGNYVQIGPLVIAWFDCEITALGGMTGNLQVGGLPVPAVAGAGERYAGAMTIWQGITLDSGYTDVGLNVMSGGSSLVEFFELGSGKSAQNVPIANLASAVAIFGTLIYLAAQPTA